MMIIDHLFILFLSIYVLTFVSQCFRKTTSKCHIIYIRTYTHTLTVERQTPLMAIRSPCDVNRILSSLFLRIYTEHLSSFISIISL